MKLLLQNLPARRKFDSSATLHSWIGIRETMIISPVARSLSAFVHFLQSWYNVRFVPEADLEKFQLL